MLSRTHVSYGLDAMFGLLLHVDNAFIALKPATALAVIEASVPPAIIKSACPVLMKFKAHIKA